MATIGDRIANIQELIGGRTDKAVQISQWLANGYRDLATTVPFETLEQTANLLCTPNSTGQTTPLDTLDYPSDARAIKSLVIGIPANAPTSQRPLKKRNIAIIDRYATNVPGVPSIWAPFNKQVYLRSVPDQAYPVVMRYWQQVVIDPADINNTVLNVPDDWLEVIDYQAMMRAYIDLQEADKVAHIRTILHGDPTKPGKIGIIKMRLTRIQAEYENSDYYMRPRKSRYSFVK